MYREAGKSLKAYKSGEIDEILELIAVLPDKEHYEIGMEVLTKFTILTKPEGPELDLDSLAKKACEEAISEIAGYIEKCRKYLDIKFFRDKLAELEELKKIAIEYKNDFVDKNSINTSVS